MPESRILDRPTLDAPPPAAEGKARLARQRMAELMEVMRAHQEATERLQQAHDVLQTEVARLTAELAHKNRLAVLGEMAAGMAHEIRNPLGGIELYASLLERELADDEPRLGMVRKVLAGASYLNAIVSDMLAFTRLPRPERRDVDLKALVAETLELAASRLEDNAVSVHVDCEPIQVRVDPSMMQRALLNLAINAAESMPEGGRLEVMAGRAEAGDGRVRIAVRDTGPGIASEAEGRLFEPFFTTKDHGTGLGLAIAHRIVEAHGGRLRAANSVEGGACFEIELGDMGSSH